MLMKLNLICCVIVLLRTSVSGYIHHVNGEFYNQWSVKIESCGSTGAEERVYTANLSATSIGSPTYDSFDANTTIVAAGQFNLTTGSSTLHPSPELVLDEYDNSDERKIYQGVLHVDSGMGWSTQKNHLKTSVIIEKNGSIRLEIYAYAGSWVAVSCANTQATVDSLIFSI